MTPCRSARLTFAGAGTAPTTTVSSVSGYAAHYIMHVMPNMMADEPIRLDTAPPVWWGKATWVAR
jgi:hypothetical protein